MTHLSPARLFSAIFLIILFSSVIAVAGDKDAKVPITTSSEEALELFLTGRDLSEKLRFQESREYYEKAVALDPDFAMAYMNLAFAQPSVKGFFENFNKAVALADKVSDGERLMILANQAANNAETMKQRGYLRKLIVAYPKDERAHNLMGNHLFGVQDYGLAIDEYNEAIKINSEFSQPYNQLGYAHRFMGNYEKAEKAFKKYVELIPDDPNPYDSYAELLMKMGKYQESIDLYRKALEINPNFVASFIGISTNYTLMGEHQQGRDELQKLRETAKDDGQLRQAWFANAVCCADEGNYAGAMECIQKQYDIAQKINDPSAMAADHVAMGNIRMEQGDYDMALADFKKAVEIIEDSDLASEVKDNGRRLFLYNSARVDAMNGNFDDASKKAEKHLAMTTELNNPFQIRLSHELAGIIALAEKKFESAVTELNQANPQNPYNHYRLAKAYEGLGEKKKAKAACKTAATYNALNNMNYSFIRSKANEMLASL